MFANYKVFTINEVGDIESYNKLIEKFVKPKTRKLSQSQNPKTKKLAKPKKLSKSRNLLNFVVKKVETSFPTIDTKTTFNCLWLTFTKASIL